MPRARVMRETAPAEGASGCCRGIPRESELSPPRCLSRKVARPCAYSEGLSRESENRRFWSCYRFGKERECVSRRARSAAQNARMKKKMNSSKANAQAADVGDLTNVLEEIARRKLHLSTLMERRSDRLDFHEHSVWSIREALEEAYRAGFAAGANAAAKKE
jgi:hypothetical protein